MWVLAEIEKLLRLALTRVGASAAANPFTPTGGPWRLGGAERASNIGGPLWEYLGTIGGEQRGLKRKFRESCVENVTCRISCKRKSRTATIMDGGRAPSGSVRSPQLHVPRWRKSAHFEGW